MKKIFIAIVFAGLAFASFAKEKISFLILPKFEIGELKGDFPGEAQYYYEEYFANKKFKEFKIKGNIYPLCVNRDGIALIVTEMGLENAGQTVTTILNDKRFDLSKAYIISTGCAGGPIERTRLGDVVLGAVTINHDLGHSNDKEDLPVGQKDKLFVRDKDYDHSGYTELNKSLIEKLYNVVKDIPLENSDRAIEVAKLYKVEARNPIVQIGGILSGNDYWAGKSAREKVEYIFSENVYNSPHSYMITEMEDSAIAVALKRFDRTEKTDYLQRYIIVRDVVDYDTPYDGGPHILEFWEETSKSGEDFDWGIFPIARKNNFKVGKAIIDYLKK